MHAKPITSHAARLLAAATLSMAPPAPAADGEQPVRPLARPASAPAAQAQQRSTSLPARGLFDGDRLTALARDKLAELVVEAIGLNVQVALIVPTGPWKIDGSGRDESDLTPARLEAVKRFLAQRGVDARRIYVESRIDARLAEPRLDVSVVGQPAND